MKRYKISKTVKSHTTDVAKDKISPPVKIKDVDNDGTTLMLVEPVSEELSLDESNKLDCSDSIVVVHTNNDLGSQTVDVKFLSTADNGENTVKRKICAVPQPHDDGHERNAAQFPELAKNFTLAELEETITAGSRSNTDVKHKMTYSPQNKDNSNPTQIGFENRSLTKRVNLKKDRRMVHDMNVLMVIDSDAIVMNSANNDYTKNIDDNCVVNDCSTDIINNSNDHMIEVDNDPSDGTVVTFLNDANDVDKCPIESSTVHHQPESAHTIDSHEVNSEVALCRSQNIIEDIRKDATSEIVDDVKFKTKNTKLKKTKANITRQSTNCNRVENKLEENTPTNTTVNNTDMAALSVDDETIIETCVMEYEKLPTDSVENSGGTTERHVTPPIQQEDNVSPYRKQYIVSPLIESSTNNGMLKPCEVVKTIKEPVNNKPHKRSPTSEKESLHHHVAVVEEPQILKMCYVLVNDIKHTCPSVNVSSSKKCASDIHSSKVGSKKSLRRSRGDVYHGEEQSNPRFLLTTSANDSIAKENPNEIGMSRTDVDSNKVEDTVAIIDKEYVIINNNESHTNVDDVELVTAEQYVANSNNASDGDLTTRERTTNNTVSVTCNKNVSIASKASTLIVEQAQFSNECPNSIIKENGSITDKDASATNVDDSIDAAKKLRRGRSSKKIADTSFIPLVSLIESNEFRNKRKRRTPLKQTPTNTLLTGNEFIYRYTTVCYNKYLDYFNDLSVNDDFFDDLENYQNKISKLSNNAVAKSNGSSVYVLSTDNQNKRKCVPLKSSLKRKQNTKSRGTTAKKCVKWNTDQLENIEVFDSEMVIPPKTKSNVSLTVHNIGAAQYTNCEMKKKSAIKTVNKSGSKSRVKPHKTQYKSRTKTIPLRKKAIATKTMTSPKHSKDKDMVRSSSKRVCVETYGENVNELSLPFDVQLVCSNGETQAVTTNEQSVLSNDARSLEQTRRSSRHKQVSKLLEDYVNTDDLSLDSSVTSDSADDDLNKKEI